jgi:hypothetical protein
VAAISVPESCVQQAMCLYLAANTRRHRNSRRNFFVVLPLESLNAVLRSCSVQSFRMPYHAVHCKVKLIEVMDDEDESFQ